MISDISRRDFIKYTTGGMAALLVGSQLPLWKSPGDAYALTQSLDFTITDAIKHMVTDNAINPATCYFWIFKEANLPAESPGPIIFAAEGDSIPIIVRNALTQRHEFAIPGIGFSTGIIEPGATFTGTITIPAASAGTYLYFDTLNAPVNRVMGLHGAFVVMPNPANGTPFSAAAVAANPKLAQLFADLGTQPWFPGLAWDEGAANPAPLPATPPFRQVIWVIHEASPTLFQDVGNTPGDFDAAVFVDRFLNNSFVPGGKNKPPAVQGDAPQFFTISGQSGHFSHNTPYICPMMRVGEPVLIRMLNPGLWTHCLHIHANHFYLLRVRNEQTGSNRFDAFEDLDPAVVQGITDNHPWMDVFGAHPMDVWEYLIPYMRPPDVPNTLGIGRADLSDPLPVIPDPIPGFGSVIRNGRLRPAPTPPGVTTWPPIQEVHMNIPRVGAVLGGMPVHMQISPLCYPMHDHSEPSQTAQGGNYNQGMISGLNFIGDRNADGRLKPPAGVSLIIDPDTGSITFPDAPVTFNDPAFGTPADNARAVYGPDPNKSPVPPAGPLPPYVEEME